jgi:hypothetical protein
MLSAYYRASDNSFQLWADDVQVCTGSFSDATIEGDRLYIGNIYDGSTPATDTLFDEMGIWSKDWNDTEVVDVVGALYQAGAGVTYEASASITYPTAPMNFNPHNMGVFSGFYSETTSWSPSETDITNITYECRWDGEGNPPLDCDTFYPSSNVTYEVQWTSDNGSTWSYVLNDYSGCPDCQSYNPEWNYTTYFFNPASFPNTDNLILRIRAYNGYAYSDWANATYPVTNCKSNWTCLQENLSSCLGDGKYACLNATDISGCGWGNMPEDFYLNQDVINNRESCCTPDWACGMYSTCQSTYKNCLVAVDNNACGEEYSGDYSEFQDRCQVSVAYDETYPWWDTAWGTRNRISFENPTNETIKTMFYPHPDRYTCAFANMSDMRLVGLDNSTGILFYNTIIPDFSFTQFQIDVPAGFSGLWGYAYCDNPSAVYESASCPLCEDFNWTFTSSGNLSWVSEVYDYVAPPTPYTPQYSAYDFALMFIDLIGKGLYVIITFVAVFVVIAIVNWGSKKIRGEING